MSTTETLYISVLFCKILLIDARYLDSREPLDISEFIYCHHELVIINVLHMM